MMNIIWIIVTNFSLLLSSFTSLYSTSLWLCFMCLLTSSLLNKYSRRLIKGLCSDQASKVGSKRSRSKCWSERNFQHYPSSADRDKLSEEEPDAWRMSMIEWGMMHALMLIPSFYQAELTSGALNDYIFKMNWWCLWKNWNTRRRRSRWARDAMDTWWGELTEFELIYSNYLPNFFSSFLLFSQYLQI